MSVDPRFLREDHPLERHDDLFVDRDAERAAFGSALRHVARARSIHGDLNKLSFEPRTNVLVFHGIGGMGKTDISRRLEALFLSPAGGIEGRRSACRVDFANDAALDPESILLRIRASAGQLGRRWYAFDLALAHYWARKHPGEHLDEFLDQTSFLTRIASQVGLREQIQGALAAAVPLVGVPPVVVPLATRISEVIFRAIREERRQKRLTKSCSYWSIVTEKVPDESRYLMPALLAWDLTQYQLQSPVHLVVFFDSWEVVQERPAVRLGLEDTLSALAYLMPNVLFVVTGRNRLAWHDARRSHLQFRGADRWPYLVDGAATEPRQHALPGLLQDVRLEYLVKSITREGRPAIDEDLRLAIAARSDGLPLYLDMATRRFDELVAQRLTPQAQDFAVDLGELLQVVLRDLPDDQRLVLRAAGLAGAFDSNLLRAAVPEVPHAAVRSFLKRDLVHRDADQPLPNFLLELVRLAVLNSNSDRDDAWSEEEWKEVGLRIFNYLGQLLEPTLRDPASADRSLVIQVFLRGFEIADRIGYVPDWLFDAMKVMSILNQWDFLERAAGVARSTDPTVQAAILASKGLIERYTGGLHRAEALYQEALEAQTLSARARVSIEYWLADTWQTRGLLYKANEVFRRLATSNIPEAEDARKDLARHDYFLAQFRSAQRWVDEVLSSASPTLRRAQAIGLGGWIKLANGLLNEAERDFRSLMKDDMLQRSGISQGTSSRNLAVAVSWLWPGAQGLEFGQRALEINTDLEDKVGIAHCHGALALAQAGLAEDAKVLSDAEICIKLLEDFGDKVEGWFGLIPVILYYAATDRPGKAAEARQRLLALLRRYGLYPYWLYASGAWMDALGVSSPDLRDYQIDWLDDAETVHSRWTAVLWERQRMAGIR